MSASAKVKTISSYYTELHKFEQNGEFDRAIKTCNRILEAAPDEDRAFHCKVICQIQISRFEEALNFMKRYPNLSKDLHFEKAYCQYRLNNPKEALKIIDSVPELDLKLRELKAQVFYRLENFEEAYKVYQEIIKNTHDEYEDERETNLVAVMSNLGGMKEKARQIREDTYELCYNAACCMISQGQYGEAEKKLKQCEKLCREALEEDGTPEEDMDAELAIVRIQLAYVIQKLGRQKEAQQIYLATLKLKLDDPALTAVASNNVVVMNKNQNLFDSKKKMKLASHDSLIHKLNTNQRKLIAFNNCILAFYTNQFEHCMKLCRELTKHWPELEPHTKVLEAIILQREEKHDQAVAVLKDVKAVKPEDELFLNLVRVQLLIGQEKRKEACDVLENMGDSTYRPGIVGALITLYLGIGDEKAALKIFEKTVQFHRKNKINEGDLSNMWRKAAEFHIKNGHPKVAANSLEELLRSNNKDKSTIAQLLLACSEFDTKRTVELSKQLPSSKEIIGDFDVEAIENHWMAMKKVTTTKVESPIGNNTPKTSDAVAAKKKKHKKRKPKMPKNYDASATPDPERWLPKYERTGYRKKRDRRTKDERIKGSQGVQSGQSEIYDFSGRQVQEEVPESPGSVQTPRVHPKKNQQKKKNKRR